MRYDADTIPVCEDCAKQDNQTKSCKRCGVEYCCHFSSTIDLRYCGNCMANFQVIETTEIRTVQTVNDQNQVIHRKRLVAKNLKLSGTDWLFASHQINTLTDEELVQTIEYHRNIANQMLLERETRKTEKYNQLSQIKLNLPPRTNVDSTGAIKATKTKKPRAASTKGVPSAEAIAAAFATLAGANVNSATVQAAMAAIASAKETK